MKETKFVLGCDCALNPDKCDGLRNALLRLINSGSAKKQDMILCAGGRSTVRICFLTPKQYQEYIKSINARE